MELEEALKKIKELEKTINDLKQKESKIYRDKIETMSSEVVDSNPYRFTIQLYFSLIFQILTQKILNLNYFQSINGIKENGNS